MKNIIKMACIGLSLGIFCTASVALGQDGKKKEIHTEKRFVNKHGNDSTVTIIKEDASNGNFVKKTIVIRNGDTTTNVMIEKSKNGDNDQSNMIIDGDSIVKIKRFRGENNLHTGNKSIIIINGDSMISSPDDNDISIMIDTAKWHEKFRYNKSFEDARKKGFVMSDKYIIINTNKFMKNDSAHNKTRNVVGKFGLEGFDLGFTQFMDQKSLGVSETNNLLDLNVGKSVNVNFRVFDLKVNLIAHKLYLNTGLEFDLHDYRFNNNITIKPNSDSFTVFKNASAHFTKDKLSTQYLEIPLMLYFNSNPNKQEHSVSLGVGGYYGILLGSYTKQISAENGKQHYYGSFQCNPIDYGVMAEIGYSNVQLYAKYNISSIFQTSKGGPDLQTVTFGIKLFHPFGWKA